MTDIFVVERNDVEYDMYAGEGHFIVGVFSKRELAHDFVLSMREPVRYSIAVWPLDAPSEFHTRSYAASVPRWRRE